MFPPEGVPYTVLCYASQNSASAINVTSPLSASVCVSGYSHAGPLPNVSGMHSTGPVTGRGEKRGAGIC